MDGWMDGWMVLKMLGKAKELHDLDILWVSDSMSQSVNKARK